MSRNKEILERNKTVEAIEKLISENLPSAIIVDRKTVPHLIGVVVWNGFRNMDASDRLNTLANVLGEYKDKCLLWCATPSEHQDVLEERISDFD